MKTAITPLFSVPVYMYKSSVNENFLIQNEIKNNIPIILEKDKFDNPPNWEGDVSTNIYFRSNTIRDYNLKNLERFIYYHAQKYLDATNPVAHPDELVLIHSWLNITTKGGRQEWHTHSDSIMSGVYYYQISEGQGKFAFRNPSQFLAVGLFPGGPMCPEKIAFQPVIGSIIIFPGWLEHSVQVNTTDTERITIAFNIKGKEQLRKGINNEKSG